MIAVPSVNLAWNPWVTLERLVDTHQSTALNVCATENEVTLTAELPGVSLDDLDVAVQDQTLRLRVHRSAEKTPEGENLLIAERATGDFARTFQLPYRIEPNKVDARLKYGVLTLRLPRMESDKPQKISVHAE